MMAYPITGLAAALVRLLDLVTSARGKRRGRRPAADAGVAERG
jgi:hypothetical protein